ncbi:MAG: MotA/TolQ/ExbB proton channel family protein [Bacteroidota bacterium]|jgi:biopolymer transport protein ExbB
MSKQKSSKGSSSAAAIFAAITVVISLIVSILIYNYVFGADANFSDNPENHKPVATSVDAVKHYYGVIHAGGPIVPLLMTVLLTVIFISVERFITLGKAGGKGNTGKFVRSIKDLLANHQIDQAIAACDKQKGSLANVVRSGLEKYKHVEGDSNLDKEQKLAAIQKELEEATALELPMLSKNLVVISTCASIGTLVGLIGTVLGMIRAFGALANAGAPDTTALATGISEALINTAIGIIASCLAIIFYNMFSNKIDSMTYSMDEASFTIVQEFSASGK